jgi:hypothetical protein
MILDGQPHDRKSSTRNLSRLRTTPNVGDHPFPFRANAGTSVLLVYQ